MDKKKVIALVLVVAAGGAGVVYWQFSYDEPGYLTICSFNIQFLGNFKDKDDESLADFLKHYDVVVVQELVAPPYEKDFPDGSPVKPDKEAQEFFDAMTELGFDYILSEEDTGTNDDIHKNSAATEWWVVFYKPEKVSPAEDLPNGFLAEDRSNHDDYERVPYAFALQVPDEKLDVVLISVHLQPGSSNSDKVRRKHELTTIATWIDANDDTEKDFIILGDMNISGETELLDATPTGYLSLNDEVVPTNTNPNSPKPYDHVMYSTKHTKEVDEEFDMKVIDLVAGMKGYWTSSDPYPGDPYDHNEFRKFYSDHHPVVFRLSIPDHDDD